MYSDRPEVCSLPDTVSRLVYACRPISHWTLVYFSVKHELSIKRLDHKRATAGYSEQETNSFLGDTSTIFTAGG